jgi:uncharacterized membrane protein YfcA
MLRIIVREVAEMLITTIKIVFIIVAAVFFVLEIRDYRKNAEEVEHPKKYMAKVFSMSCVVEFFDSIGIGSFPVLTAIYRIFKMVPDELIPATLSIGTVIPCVYQSVGFLTKVEVDTTTLVTMMAAAIIGGFVGTSVAKKVTLKYLRLIMGLLMVLAAIMMLISQLGLVPIGGEATGLHGGKLIFAIVCNFVLAFGTSFGGSMYGPLMCVIYLLGMNPLCAFPIMMCSATLSCTTNAFIYLRAGKFHRRAALSVELAAFVGVTIAIFFVTSLPLNTLRWIVLFVVTYNAISLLRDAFRKNSRPAAAETKSPVNA